MNLTETYSMTMKEVLEKCNITEQKIHTDDEGNIQAIEVKYIPKEESHGIHETHEYLYTK